MNGDNSAQYKTILSETNKFAAQIQSSDVGPNTIFYTLQSFYMKTIEYCFPFPVTNYYLNNGTKPSPQL